MIRYRSMSVAELESALGWAAAEGWNPGTGDAAAFHAADPEGFFLAIEDESPVAAISVVNHSDRFAFLGLYLCRPDRRGRGIGFGLWRHALAHAGHRTVGLDGVPDQQANYARSGFVLAGQTTRFVGPVAGRADPAVRRAVERDIAELAAREATASGWEKPAYLAEWFRSRPDRVTLVLDEGGLRGGATVRQCLEGAKIGPLMAADAADAERLIRHAATLFGPEVVIDVPDSSPELDALCRELGMQPGFHTARMYRGDASAPVQGVFAVTTLELG